MAKLSFAKASAGTPAPKTEETPTLPAPEIVDPVEQEAGVTVTDSGEVVPTEVVKPAPIGGSTRKSAFAKPAPAKAPEKVKAPKAAPAPEPETQQPAAQAAAQATAQVPARRDMTGGLVKEGSDWISFEDIVLPRLNIAQRVGEVGENFPKGAIVLGKSIVVGDLENPAEVVFIGFREPQYVTVVKGGLGEILSRAEFENVNGTTSREEADNNPDKVLCQKLLTALVAVRAPEGADLSAFPYEYESQGDDDAHLVGNYALGFLSCKGGSYYECAKIVLSHRRIGPLRNGFTHRIFQLKTEDRLYKQTGNKAFLYKLGQNAPTTEPFRKWLASVLEVSKEADEGGADE